MRRETRNSYSFAASRVDGGARGRVQAPSGFPACAVGKRQPVRLLALGTALFLLLAPLPARAHEFGFTETRLTLTADGAFEVRMTIDLDALAMGVPASTDNAELARTIRALPAGDRERRIERLRELFQRRVRVRFDGEPAPFDVTFPDYGTPVADQAPIPTVLGLTARLTGAVPAGARAVQFSASRSFPAVHLTIEDRAREFTSRAVLAEGEPNEPFALVGPPAQADRVDTIAQYLMLGFWHIVPEGVDHILFVLGLYLLNARLRPLVWQVTAFTVAHALTLALATYDVIALPARVVEPLIALSIAYVAFENVATDQLRPWRPAVVFAFGLLHGLGFAGVLRELGLPAEERVTGLVAFNAGIELGQLAAVAAAMATVGWFSRRTWYRPRVGIPLSLAIGAIGVIWAIERVFAGG